MTPGSAAGGPGGPGGSGGSGDRGALLPWGARGTLGGVALALMIGFLGGWAAGGGVRAFVEFPSPSGGHTHGEGGGVPLSDAGKRVATGLKCPCGCPDLLISCGCANPRGAIEVKRTIMELLSNGRSETQARIELVNRYGAAIQRVGR